MLLPLRSANDLLLGRARLDDLDHWQCTPLDWEGETQKSEIKKTLPSLTPAGVSRCRWGEQRGFQLYSAAVADGLFGCVVQLA